MAAPITPSYHDLHVETESIQRTRLADLPFDMQVTCTRAGGWELFHDGVLLAGEYDRRGLRLDIGGVVIVDSLLKREES